MKMRVLILDGYFLPEQIAFTHLEMDLLRGLVEKGHKIEIVCPTPTRGISKQLARDYRKKKEEYMLDGQAHVVRFWAPQERNSPLSRAIRYAWCNLRTYQLGARTKDVDVIFANSTPPTQGLTAGLVKKKLNRRNKGRQARFVYDLCDVFPDSLVNAGLTTSKSLLFKLGRRIEDKTYRSADDIIAVSESNRNNIALKGVAPEKCCVIPDWIDTEVTKPVPKDENDLFDRFGIARDKFTVVYAGNMGEAQNADILITCAEMLRKEDIQFVLFGGGARYQEIKKSALAKGLKQVFIHDLLPLEEVSKVYSLGDLCVITCKKGTGTAGMPSKAWSIMACNTYIVASFDCESELAEILRRSGGGTTVPSEDPERLKGEILREFAFWKDRGKRKCNPRAYVKESRSRDVCVGKAIRILEKTAL